MELLQPVSRFALVALFSVGCQARTQVPPHSEVSASSPTILYVRRATAQQEADWMSNLLAWTPPGANDVGEYAITTVDGKTWSAIGSPLPVGESAVIGDLPGGLAMLEAQARKLTYCAMRGLGAGTLEMERAEAPVAHRLRLTPDGNLELLDVEPSLGTEYAECARFVYGQPSDRDRPRDAIEVTHRLRFSFYDPSDP